MGYYPYYTIDNSYVNIDFNSSNPCNQNGGYPTVIAVPHFAEGGGLGPYADPVAAANGNYNTVYANFWSKMATCAATIYALRMDWEWHGNWYPFSPYHWNGGTYNNPSISPSTYIAGQRNFINAMRANPATAHIKVAWDYPEMTPATNGLAYYPGDAYVDIVSGDVYFDPRYHGATSAAAWNLYNTYSNGNINSWSAFAKAHGKPMAAWEWCDAYFDGYNITQFSNFMKANPFVAHSYWDSNNAGESCHLQNHPTNLTAYENEWKNWNTSGTFWGHLIPIPSTIPAGF
jgi:hypothetical protein